MDLLHVHFQDSVSCKTGFTYCTKVGFFSNMTSQMLLILASGCKSLCAKNALKASLAWIRVLSHVVHFELTGVSKPPIARWTLDVPNSIMSFFMVAQTALLAKSLSTCFTFVMLFIQVGIEVRVSDTFGCKLFCTKVTRMFSFHGVHCLCVAA